MTGSIENENGTGNGNESELVPPEPILREYDSDSILDYVKKNIGLAHDYEFFDVDIITGINAAFLTLNQLGIGPKRVFFISDYTSKWQNFLENSNDLEAVKYYIYLKVRTLFDPPSNSYVLDAIDRQIAELEWRLNSQVEREEENKG